MAATEFGSGSAQAVKRWSNSLAREVLDTTDFKKFSGKSENSIIQIHMDLESQPGDEVKYDVLYQNRGNGVQGDTTLEGYEEALEFYQDSVKIDQLRQAHNNRKMTQQRTVHDLRAVSKSSLGAWFGWKLTTLMYAYLAGVAGDDSENAAGTIGTSGFAGNALSVPDADHHLNKTGSAMSLAFIDTLVARAKTVNPRIRPVMIDGKRHYVLVLHPYSIHALRSNTGAKAWADIQMNANVRADSNPIFTGAMGVYNGVVIHESEFIPRATATTAWSGAAANDTANLFLGAQSGAFAMGNAYDKMDSAAMGGGAYFKWVEQKKDYDNNKGIGVAGCFGIKPCVFNSKRFGMIRLTTTDAQPS